MFFLAISNAMVESFAGLTLFGFVGRQIIKPRLQYLKSSLNIMLILFFFFILLSLFNSGEYFGKSLHALIGKWGQYLGICLVIQDSVFGSRAFKRGVAVFLFGAFLAILSGFTQYFFNIEFLRGNAIAMTNDQVRAIASSFAHYNSFAAYLVVVIPLLVSLFFIRKKLAYNFFLMVFIGLAIASILLTFSRGSWLALFISFIIFIFLGKGFKWFLPIAIFVFLIFFVPIFQERLAFIFSEGGDTDRFRYWGAAWKMIESHPFLGTGVGSFMILFPRYLPDLHAAYAHNCFLQIWAESGIFSLVIFVSFISWLIYLGVKTFSRNKDYLLLGLISGFIGFLVHSFFDTDLYVLRLAVLFWTWAGLLIARVYKGENYAG